MRHRGTERPVGFRIPDTPLPEQRTQPAVHVILLARLVFLRQQTPWFVEDHEIVILPHDSQRPVIGNKRLLFQYIRWQKQLDDVPRLQHLPHLAAFAVHLDFFVSDGLEHQAPGKSRQRLLEVFLQCLPGIIVLYLQFSHILSIAHLAGHRQPLPFQTRDLLKPSPPADDGCVCLVRPVSGSRLCIF